MLPQAEVAGQPILNDQEFDVELGGGKAFSGVINGNPAAHIRNAPVSNGVGAVCDFFVMKASLPNCRELAVRRRTLSRPKRSYGLTAVCAAPSKDVVHVVFPVSVPFQPDR